MMTASFFLDALCDSPFFAINCDVLLEASIINDENSHSGLSRVWQAGLFDLESYYQRTEDEPHAQTMPGWLPPVPSSVPRVRPVHSHPLSGIRVTDRSQEARLVREAGKKTCCFFSWSPSFFLFRML